MVFQDRFHYDKNNKYYTLQLFPTLVSTEHPDQPSVVIFDPSSDNWPTPNVWLVEINTGDSAMGPEFIYECSSEDGAFECARKHVENMIADLKSLLS